MDGVFESKRSIQRKGSSRIKVSCVGVEMGRLLPASVEEDR